MKFIERNRHRPFFCYISTNAPHAPHLVEPSYSDPYLPLTPHEQRAKFYGMVAKIDKSVGELRRRLREMGLEENTIFIFMTDNGSSGELHLDEDHFVVAGFNAGMRGKLRASNMMADTVCPSLCTDPRTDLTQVVMWTG